MAPEAILFISLGSVGGARVVPLGVGVLRSPGGIDGPIAVPPGVQVLLWIVTALLSARHGTMLP